MQNCVAGSEVPRYPMVRRFVFTSSALKVAANPLYWQPRLPQIDEFRRNPAQIKEIESGKFAPALAICSHFHVRDWWLVLSCQRLYRQVR